jgi:hypothetical protein
MEIWKSIPNYEGLYSVSNYGRIKRDFRIDYIKSKLGNVYEKTYEEMILKFGYTRGYCKVTLFDEFKNKKTLQVHRIVLKTFNPVFNMENLTVNHKDGIKYNNHVDNLEWMDMKSQVKHAIDLGLRKPLEQSG